jgi:flagellar hook assembly protein FlgD
VPRYDSDIEIIEDAYPRKVTLQVDARVFCPSCGDEDFEIVFGGPGSSNVVLRLFDGSGREIKTLYSGTSVGEATFRWDGTGNDGKMVPAGLYICHIEIIEATSGRTTTETAPIVVGVQLK